MQRQRRAADRKVGQGQASVEPPEAAGGIYVFQKHQARQLHYDLRLEGGGVLLSWAVPKGPSLDPAQKRLAVRVEDHPLEYADFEGVISQGEYGAGTVMVWDIGTFEPLKDESLRKGLEEGLAEFRLRGVKLKGGWKLVRMSRRGADNWLLIKKNDEHADRQADVTKVMPDSALTGRSMEEIQREESGAQ